MRPIIAIASEEIKKPSLSAFPFSWYITNEAYIKAIDNAGGIPILLPPSTEAISMIKEVDGLLLQGGADVDPSSYKEERHACCGESSIEEDRFHIQLLIEAEKQNKPVLGICRGMQLINAAFGGTLYQDRKENPGFAEHLNKELYADGVHTISIRKDSFLAKALKEEHIKVNSLHHQMIKNLAPGFKVAAESCDGVIEAIERGNIWAVQWHPEAMLSVSDSMKSVFSAFLALC